LKPSEGSVIEIFNVYGVRQIISTGNQEHPPTPGSTPVSYADSPASGGQQNVGADFMSAQPIRIDVSGLATGVYFVRVGGKMQQFVVIR